MDQCVDGNARLGSDAAPNDHLARRHAARLTSVLGIGFGVLFLVGLAMLNRTPGPQSTDQELASFYASGAQRGIVLGGLYVLPLAAVAFLRSEEHTSELQSLTNLVCRLLLEKKKISETQITPALKTTVSFR